MKNLFCCVMLLLLSSAAWADLVIIQDVEVMGQNLTTTMKVKGGLTRMDINPQMSVIMNTTTGDLKTLMHDQKMYMAMNAEAIKSMIQSAGVLPTEKPEIKSVGKKETINGFETEEYSMTQGTTVTRLWLAKDFPLFETFKKTMESMKNGPIGQMNPQAQMDFSQLPGMPIKTVVVVGGNTTTSVVKSVEEKELPASDFDVPADYTTMSFPTSPAPGK